MKYFLVFLLFLFCDNNAFASTSAVDVFNPKKQTPTALLFERITMPKDFGKSNDLTRVAGSFDIAIGEPLYIVGQVTDAFGVPIDGVIIRIWHTNAAGKYQAIEDEDSNYIDKNFIGSGQTTTDNMGNYGFLTIFPGYYEDRAPHVNFIIAHPKFGMIETEMYFESHPRNEKDPYYLSYDEQEKKFLTATVKNATTEKKDDSKIATFNIVMDGIQSYKGF